MNAIKPPTPGRDSNVPTVLSAAIVMSALGIIVSSTRFYVRIFVLKSFGWDDWTMVLATMHTIAVLVCFIGQVLNGGGHHWYDLGVPDEWEALRHWEYAQVCINIFGVSVVKISVGLGLLRFMKGKWEKRFIISMLVFVVLSTLAGVGPLLFECNPQHISWAYTRTPGACMPIKSFVAVGQMNGALNVFTDFVFVVTPIPTIIKLKVNRITKISLVAVLSIGFLAVATALARLVVGQKPWQAGDWAWDLGFYLWNSAELNAGIIAASLPPLRPIMGHWLKDTARRFRTTDSPGYGKSSNSRGTRHGYHKQDEIHLDQWSRENHNTNAPVVMSTGYGKGDASSEEGILPSNPKSIVRQTEIVIHKD
ncbi:hypothetical protein GQ53DRAFT_822970 [Thozetella sp. PMI_491]|nr:hypothetical protein GQ53DRAFT_822970 [Thozetella sp. PMI_491]